MPGIPLLGRFFGNTISNAAGFAAGGATARVLHPQLQSLANEGWQLHPDYPLDAGALANGVAQGQVPYDYAQVEATRTGVNKTRFDHLVDIANTGPGVPAAFDLWRRGEIDQAGFRRAAKRQGLEAEWIDALVKIKLDVLSPGELAAAIHRGLVPDPGLLKGEQPEPPFKVEAYPVYQIPTLDEAAAGGYDRDHLGVLVGLQGLPMGTHEAAQAFFRGIITHGDYIRAFNESNSRNEWAQAVLDYSRQIPTARDFFENALRGHHDFEWAVKQAERHGMSADDALVIYQNQGRPLNLHQITQALAYGAKYNPAPTDVQDPYTAAVLLGPVRPEFYELNEALKYTLPSALYFRTLQQQKVLSEEQAATWYRRLGWPPDLADQVARAYATTRTAAAKEATATDLLTLYDGEKLSRAEALADLEALGYPADEAARKLDVLEARRVAGAKQSAIGDLHTDYKKGALTDEATIAALEALSISADSAAKIIAAWTAYRTAAAAPRPTA